MRGRGFFFIGESYKSDVLISQLYTERIEHTADLIGMGEEKTYHRQWELNYQYFAAALIRPAAVECSCSYHPESIDSVRSFRICDNFCFTIRIFSSFHVRFVFWPDKSINWSRQYNENTYTNIDAAIIYKAAETHSTWMREMENAACHFVPELGGCPFSRRIERLAVLPVVPARLYANFLNCWNFSARA